MKKIKAYLSDLLLFFGLLLLASGIYVEYGIGYSLIVSGSLILIFGYRLMPKRKG